MVEPQAPRAELLAQNPVLLPQIVNDLELALVHTPGDGDQDEPERVEDSRHVVAPLSPTSSERDKARTIHGDPIFGPYEVIPRGGTARPGLGLSSGGRRRGNRCIMGCSR